MNKKITIRDVAQAAGVSISTVHQALNDKPGVSEVTREHIRRIADDLGYRPNKMASGLKRRTQRVAVLLPDEVGRNRFYYPPLWQGVRDYLKNSEDLNVECTEFSFPNEIDPFHSRGVEEVRALLAEDKLDGLLTVGHMEAMTMQEWQHARDAGVAVVQVGFRNPKIAPLCSVQPDYEVIGRTMAELIFSHIPSFGSVVLCAGNPKWEQHARIVQGFEDYMQENGAQNRIYLDNSCCIGSEAQRNILNLLEKPDVAACCSVLDYRDRCFPQKALGVFHQDFEAQYTVTTEYVERTFERIKGRVEPYWVCLPMATRTALSSYEMYWYPWDDTRRDAWVREMPQKEYVVNLEKGDQSNE